MAHGGLGIGLSSVESCIGAGSLMIRNSLKGSLFFFRRIRGGNDSFCDSVVDDSHTGALMDRSDCEDEGRERVEEREMEVYSRVKYVVVGMSEGDSWPVCWNCATRFRISTNPATIRRFTDHGMKCSFTRVIFVHNKYRQLEHVPLA